MTTINGTAGKDELLATGSGQTLLGLEDNDIIDGVTGLGNNTLDGGVGDDEIFAKTDDLALGGQGNDFLYSDGNGNNNLSGGDGDDEIFPDRNDRVFGDAGNDVIYAGLGGNTFTGGAGEDIFWLANVEFLEIPNIITDFNPSEDELLVDVDGIKQLSGLTFTKQQNDTLISANGRELAIIQNNILGLANGIASGDTTQTSSVLWARSTFLGQVTFEYSTDRNFNTIAGVKTATVTNINVPVKVDISGLNPGTKYYYRVTDAVGVSAVGQFQTAATLGSRTGLRFGVAGDWRGELAPYPAISNVPERDLAFFVAHGDTIYADVGSDAVLNPDGSRKSQAETIDEYRAKHNEVYSTRLGRNTWADLRASTAILATIDDNEVINDFAGGADASTDPRFGVSSGFINDTPLYENGLQAFQEYNPLRDEFYGNVGSDRFNNERKLYRYNTYGSDAAVFVLDGRSFRDKALQPPSDINNPNEINRVLNESLTQNRTLLGSVQLADLKRDLLAAQAGGITWKFVMTPQPIQNIFPGVAVDSYEGYGKERTELLRFIQENNIDNVVFVAADVHGTFVNNLTYQEQPQGTQIATRAWEITTGAVAFDPPTGKLLAERFWLNDAAQRNLYNSLPIAPDLDDQPNDQDDFVKQAINNNLAALGFDPLGLNQNLSQAEGLINATLLEGDYFVGHTYGWTEFDVNPTTQALTVTTYGINSYSEEELNINTIPNLSPKVVSKFVVNPQFRNPLPPPRPPLVPLEFNNNNILNVSADSNLKIQLTGVRANTVNEVGFFVVRDDVGTITDVNGNLLTPGAGDAYIQAALRQSQVLLSAITNLPNGFSNANSNRIINTKAGDRLVFYLINNGTTDGVVRGRIPASRVTLGSNFGSGNLSQLQTTSLGDNKWSLAWGGEQMVLSLERTPISPVIGTKLQIANPSELIDLRDVSGLVNADFSIFREAAFNNEVYFYNVNNVDGLIGNINPNTSSVRDYIQAALNNLVRDALTGEVVRFAVANQGTQTGKATIAGGSILAPMIIVNGTRSQLTDSNPNNDPQVYFPYLGVNSDGVDHIRLLGDNTFGFEDLPNGGDLDYNDIIVKINFSGV
ncbi:phosphodiesterase/alkaline phosphatase D [Nostoc sp. PCC 7524]|uniref:alkaline phosphatase D family protein n=1 Tax=Nostoc sp. (strain ATCC 29411 / PCC 7524) TaxID=28072 RepID=UPI00029F4076|nr:alkaline phosphatase D family protein [Nostoc sp. PCC 7524]AFY48976.1 phosphodiesterase/alkaline phosphatase D [Nostoc sp. PCC 7524]